MHQFLPVFVLFIASVTAAHADCQWPPLHAAEVQDSHTETVGDVAFSSGYRSWFVPSYQIDENHCQTNVELIDWRWSLVFDPHNISDNPPLQAMPRQPSTLASSISALPPVKLFASMDIASMDTLPSFPFRAQAQLPELPTLD